jgi:tetratricopeptide (TPR) repeat protein
MTALVFLFFTMTLMGEVEPLWKTQYQLGMERLEAGEHATAYLYFERALATQPEERLAAVEIDGTAADYLPHLYLCVTAYHQGELEGARRHLAAAETSGRAAESAVGGPLLDHYRTLLFPRETGDRGRAAGGGDAAERAGGEPGGVAAETGEDPDRGRVSPPEAEAPVTGVDLAALRGKRRMPEVLEEQDVIDLIENTLVRCGLPSSTEVPRAPWYFHYELGLELAAKGDPQRSVDYLLAAAERKPMSRRFARMYGMWFTHYRPYLEIASSHAQLGNWKCAFNALLLAERMGEVDTSDANVLDRYRDLITEVENKLMADD